MPSPAVLVVEDDASVQTTLCATLALLGFTPHHAQTIDDALGILGREHIDAVTLDIRLPDPKGLQRSGLSLLAFLRATPEYANVPVVIFTGMPLSENDEALARKHGAEVFYKPQPYSVLVSQLNRSLDREPAA
jgi:DNA-binding response OmpR family regulator